MGKPVLVTYAPVPELGWAVILEEPLDAALANVEILKRYARSPGSRPGRRSGYYCLGKQQDDWADSGTSAGMWRRLAPATWSTGPVSKPAMKFRT